MKKIRHLDGIVPENCYILYVAQQRFSISITSDTGEIKFYVRIYRKFEYQTVSMKKGLELINKAIRETILNDGFSIAYDITERQILTSNRYAVAPHASFAIYRQDFGHWQGYKCGIYDALKSEFTTTEQYVKNEVKLTHAFQKHTQNLEEKKANN